MSRLTQLQDNLVARIAGLAEVATPPVTPVLAERHGDLNNWLARGGASHGIQVVVTPAQLYRLGSDPLLNQVNHRTWVLAMENVLLNRAQPSFKMADQLAEVCALNLHNWVITGGFGVARTVKIECISLEYGYASEALWAIPLGQWKWNARENNAPLVYRVLVESEFDY